MRIATGAMTLRYPREADAARLFELASDGEVTGWFSWGPYSELRQAQRWVRAASRERRYGRDLAFVIELAHEGVVGVTSLNELARRDRRAAVGTWIGRRWWGTGVNRQSKVAMVHLAFAICGMRRLTAYVNVENERSARALTLAGFRREGVLERWHRHGDRELDVAVFRLLPEHWSAPAVDVVGTPPRVWIVA